MNGNTERAQCALSLVCIPQEMEKKGSEKNKTGLFRQNTYLRNKKHMLTCQGGTGCYRF